MKLSEKAHVNNVAIKCHITVVIIVLMAYVLEYFKGTKTLGYLLMCIVIASIPVILELIFFRMNKESEAIRHFMGFGYSFFYIVINFTTDNPLVFTYCLPMYIIITLFTDIKYCVSICTGGLIVNIARVVYTAKTVGYEPAEIANAEIQIILMALIGIFIVIVSASMKKTNGGKLRSINEQKEQTDLLLENVLTTSTSIMEKISDTSQKMEALGESVIHIHSSMQEVTSGSTETANSVQNQLKRTEQIQEHIEKVKDVSEEIDQDVLDTAKEVELGKDHMNALSAHVEESIVANDQVTEQMKVLGENTAQMNSIIETITSIANRTGLLALNASIEAARAGEAGKGFAVVADEISTLANRTKVATVDITDLIESIGKEIVAVSSAVEVVIEGNHSNAQSTKEVVESFARITEGTNRISGQTDAMKQIVKKLERANVILWIVYRRFPQ